MRASVDRHGRRQNYLTAKEDPMASAVFFFVRRVWFLEAVYQVEAVRYDTVMLRLQHPAIDSDLPIT